MDENQQQSKVNKSADELVNSIVIYLYLVNPWADRAKLHDDVGLFRNARITSDRSEILTVACKHSKPITWRVLAPNYQKWPWKPIPKIIFVRFQSATMTSDAKRQRYSVAEALDKVFDDEREHGGICSGEESELDRKLENPNEESR